MYGAKRLPKPMVRAFGSSTAGRSSRVATNSKSLRLRSVCRLHSSAVGISSTACQRPSLPSRSHQSGPTKRLRMAAISGASHDGMWTPLVTELMGTWVSCSPRHASFQSLRETAPCRRLTPTD